MEASTRVKLRGSRVEVWEGRAQQTSGGLVKADLVFNEKSGKIITSKEKARGEQMRELMMARKKPVPGPIEVEGPALRFLPDPPAEPVEPPKKPRAPRKPRAKKIKEDADSEPIEF